MDQKGHVIHQKGLKMYEKKDKIRQVVFERFPNAQQCCQHTCILQIPLETKAKEIWGAQPQRSECQEEDERTPLLAGGGGEGGMLAR